MKSALMDRNGMLRFIGVLVERRILHDSANEALHVSNPYPLNSGQINETAENLMALCEGCHTEQHRSKRWRCDAFGRVII